MIDDRGRVFGKVNLIDALVGVFVVLLIPLAYGTALLFRVPPPKITSIEPTQVVAHSTVTLRVTGEDLQPFLQASIGPGVSPLAVESPTVGRISLPDLAAGTYDVALYDQARELVRVPGVLTVVAPPAPTAPSIVRIDLQVVGAFVGLSSTVAGQIGLGATFPAGDDDALVAEVLALQAPEPWMRRVRVSPTAFVEWEVPGEQRLPAIVRLRCAVVIVDDYCWVGDEGVAPGATLTLPWSLPPSSDDPATATPAQTRFLIDEVRSASMPPIFP